MATRAVTKTKDVCGIWIEFLDERGNTVSRHIVDRWRGRYMPRIGDSFDLTDCIGRKQHRGVVVERNIELQHTADGEPRLWIQLAVRLSTVRIGPCELLPEFSRN